MSLNLYVFCLETKVVHISTKSRVMEMDLNENVIKFVCLLP
jgi:hypothetical protein